MRQTTLTTHRNGRMLATGIQKDWTNAASLEATLINGIPEGQYARVEAYNEHNYDIDIYTHGTGDYLVTIMVTTTGIQLEERYYPAHDAPYSASDAENYCNSDTQINILGRYATVGHALRSYREKGTTTTTGRKPIEIYI